MDKKVYYGEYTLRYWIELLLRKDLVLPDYQRSFVWTESQVKEFIKNIEDDGFVPPVIIGVCNIGGQNHNLILDGQQRLSSLLLAYFDVYPKKEAFPKRRDELPLADGMAEEDEDEPEIEYINWSLRFFADKGPAEKDIRDSITLDLFTQMKCGVHDDFFDNHFLPFSFIIPNTTSDSEQNKFYSTAFRNINILGTPLNPIESRQSLYFQKTELKDFFSPACCANYKIEFVGKSQSFDFVRAMSLLSQYKKDGNATRLAQSYKPRMEKYYEEYIYSVVNNRADGMFKQFSSIFTNNNYEPKITKFQATLRELDYQNLHFTSIIDIDVYMFGLIYYTVIEGNDINIESRKDLLKDLKSLIDTFKADESHRNSPSLLKHMRNRVGQSIDIFKHYVLHPAL